MLARVDHLDMWEVAEPHHLREELKATRDHRLGSDDRSKDSYYQRWVEHSRWDGVEERVRISCFGCIAADIGSLSDVCK